MRVWIPALAQWVKDLALTTSCGVGPRYSWDAVLLWLWLRLGAAVPFQPLAWELPYATSELL